MIKKVLTIFIILLGFKSYGQVDKNQYIGINLLQLPTSTINLNYSVDYNPFLTPIVDVGYAFGYNENYDLIGTFLTPHIKLHDGYTIDKQSGGYLKLGGFLNLRNNFEKQSFFHLGLFLTNSIVYESGSYLSPDDSSPNSTADEIEHTVYLFGFSSSFGYEFKATNRLKINIDFQLSFPTDKYLDLYSYGNFIPGMEKTY